MFIAWRRVAEQILESFLAATMLPLAGLIVGCGEYHEEKFEEVARRSCLGWIGRRGRWRCEDGGEGGGEVMAGIDVSL